MGLTGVVVLLAGAPGLAGHDARTTRAPRLAASAPKTGTSRATAPTTRPVSHVTGPVTVLSPIGLNVRAGPSRSAKVIGTAAQGVVLQLLAHTNQDGGWYKVRGATVTGWISADPGYSAPGHFGYYASSAFSVLFPAGWTTSGKPKTGVVFRPHAPPEEVVVTTATSVNDLPTVSQGAGLSEHSSQQVDACGVTADLYSYSTSSPDKFYADIALAIGSGHALGLKATLTSLSQMRTVLDFVNSISFPLPICVGKPAAKH
jgi:uncharacterized protein YgiM (DUF1202 family)